MAKKDQPKTLMPKLRFPEFKRGPGWEEKPLESLLSPISREKEKPDGPYTGLGVRSHGKGTFLKPFEAPEKNSMERMYEVHADDLIVNITFAWEGAIAVAQRTDTGALVSHRFPTYTFNDAALPDFFRYSILDRQLIYQLGVISPGGAGRNRVLNKRDFLKLKRFVPSLAEQRKIAACLTSLDELLAAEGRKLEGLRAHKKGLMQQLFPREGESRPRLRFPEFRDAGEWEEKTLGEIAKISTGTTPLRANPEFYEGGTIPWVKTTDLNNSFIDVTEECITPKARATVNPVGSVIVAMYGGFKQIGRTGLLKIPAATNQALSVLRTREDEVLPVYLLTWLNAKVEDWKRIASSSRKDPNITGSDVARFPIQLPGTAEQQRIAACLGSLDALIAAQSRKLDGLRSHKKGLMQQLFPSPEGV